ncbi:hypothetical protein Pelo_9818 [Pelomyxa schiedti]|nr:hypothetical protein Pelo_9818 [Pelomyxa schiedti]
MQTVISTVRAHRYLFSVIGVGLVVVALVVAGVYIAKPSSKNDQVSFEKKLRNQLKEYEGQLVRAEMSLGSLEGIRKEKLNKAISEARSKRDEIQIKLAELKSQTGSKLKAARDRLETQAEQAKLKFKELVAAM